jgi:hypothetical protein
MKIFFFCCFYDFWTKVKKKNSNNNNDAKLEKTSKNDESEIRTRDRALVTP